MQLTRHFLIAWLVATAALGETKVRDAITQGAPVNAIDAGAVPDGTDVSLKLQAALNSKAGLIYMPASTTCYSIGTTGISVPQGRTLQGAGMGGAGSGPTCIKYTGTGCGILFDSVSFSTLKDLDVQVDSANAGAQGVCLKSTTGVAEFNLVENVSIRQINATNHVVGQSGLFLSDTGNGVYWNTFRRLRASGWDVSYRLVGGATQGVNDNDFYSLMSWSHITGMRLTSTGFANDNYVSGLKCSRSDGAWAGNENCLLIGDDNSASFGNQFFGVVSDQGAPSVCGTLGTSARANYVVVTCESGGPFTDNAVAATFPNYVWDGVSSSRMRTGPIIGIAASGTGSNPANLILGPTLASGVSGIRNRSSRIIVGSKGAPVDCAGANLTPTVSSILDFSIYTCATAQTLTLPTAQGASGLVQNLPGNGTAFPPVSGDLFQFVMSSTAAANFTLVAGAGATIVGNAVINNAQKIWICRVTSVTVNAETISCY